MLPIYCTEYEYSRQKKNSKMACAEDWGRSQMLQRLAKQLQFYKPPSVLDEMEDDNDNGIGLSSGISCNSLAVRNVQCSCANNLRERRAAVLICLFEGPEGELRVILTRRSMKLASHPGTIKKIIYFVTVLIYSHFVHMINLLLVSNYIDLAMATRNFLSLCWKLQEMWRCRVAKWRRKTQMNLQQH